MRDYLEKYLLIRDQFPNKAGKLMQVITTQKRQIKKIGRTKDKEVQALMLASAEGYDVAVELLEWMKDVLQGVLNDAHALKDGTALRNTIKEQSLIVEAYLALNDHAIKQATEKLQNRPK